MQESAHPLALRVNTAQRVAAYAAFAAVSTTLNLVVQQIAVMSMTGRAAGVLPLSILVGTAAGFGAKYLLDKHFIFFDRSTTCRDETARRRSGPCGRIRHQVYPRRPLHLHGCPAFPRRDDRGQARRGAVPRRIGSGALVLSSPPRPAP